MQEQERRLALRHFVGAHADCVSLHGFMLKLAQEIDRATVETRDDQTVHGLLVRGVLWMGSIRRLTDALDLQAYMTACRSLFEAAVDLTLLVYDADEYPIEKLHSWELSQKLYAAEKTRDYFDGLGQPLSFQFDGVKGLLAKDATSIRQLRMQWWPTRKNDGLHHPSRWTGVQTTLKDDSIAADALRPSDFAKYYQTQYPQDCWFVHGSGLTGLRGMGHQVPALAAVSLRECSRFGALMTELVARKLSMWDAAMASRFGDERNARALAARAAMGP